MGVPHDHVPRVRRRELILAEELSNHRRGSQVSRTPACQASARMEANPYSQARRWPESKPRMRARKPAPEGAQSGPALPQEWPVQPQFPIFLFQWAQSLALPARLDHGGLEVVPPGADGAAWQTCGFLD